MLGYPTAISRDGTAVVGAQLGTQRIPGAPPWIVVLAGGTSCVAPAITTQPTAAPTFNACSSSITISTFASGTAPFTYQWFKDGSPLTDRLTGSGSTVSGAATYLLRVNGPLTPADAGTYHCVVTGQCGTPAQTNNSVVGVDPAFPAGSATNDLCSGAQIVTAGTNVLSPAQSPCAAYLWDASVGFGCSTGQPKNDRWFQFTPATSGNYRFETCGANYDTHLSLFSICGGGELACNNDYTTGPSASCNSSRSRVASVALSAGVPVYIRLSAANGAFLSGTSTMNLSILTAPAAAANDLCINASTAVLGANPLDTTEANADDVVSCTTAISRDVWFLHTPAQDGFLSAATCPGTTWNTVLSMHDSCFGAELGCNDNANVTGCTNQSRIDNIEVNAGTPYYFRVGGNSATAFGTGTLTLTFAPKGSCCVSGVCTVTTQAACTGTWISGGTCTGGAGGCCPLDLSANGIVDADDIFAFLNIWFAGPPGGTCSGCQADWDGDGFITADDIFDYLNDWFAFGPGLPCP